MNAIIIPVIGIIIVLVLFNHWNNRKWKTPKEPFPAPWRIVLVEKVNFYSSLNPDEKKLFEFKIQEFLLNCRITGIDTRIDEVDRLLVAASAIIPIFAFPDWKYMNLEEVLIYPGGFNEKFETSAGNKSIMGMVGTGYMEGKMILSKPALHTGFNLASDKKNTAVHEFVHLIDKADGSIDGIPSALIDKQYSIPWFQLINKKIEEIYERKSDINPYGATNQAEFYAVISEYFFERPRLLAENHPELYSYLVQIFKQKMKQKNLSKVKTSISRNDPCPCGSGEKFKKCCGALHYE